MRLFTVSERGVEAGIPVVQEPVPHLVVGEPGHECRLLLMGDFRELAAGRLLQADMLFGDGRDALVALRFAPPSRGTVRYAVVRDGTEHSLSEGDGYLRVLATGTVGLASPNGSNCLEHLVAIWPGAEIRVRLQSGYREDGTAQDGVAQWRYLIRWDGEALRFTDFREQETRQGFE